MENASIQEGAAQPAPPREPAEGERCATGACIPASKRQ
jgi:hypothetical protein